MPTETSDTGALAASGETEHFGWKEHVLTALAIVFVWLSDIGSKLLASLGWGWTDTADESDEE